MSDIGRDPAWGALGPGYEEPPEKRFTSTELMGGFICPFCSEELQAHVETELSEKLEQVLDGESVVRGTTYCPNCYRLVDVMLHRVLVYEAWIFDESGVKND